MTPAHNIKIAADRPAYIRRRDDGWPFCPGCDEDELWSSAIPATEETIVSCLRCDWKPGYPSAPETRRTHAA